MIEKIKKYLTLWKKAKAIRDSGVAWKTIYDLIFSEEISHQLDELFEIEWYNPDCDYDDDVLAYLAAVNAKAEELQKVLHSMESISE